MATRHRSASRQQTTFWLMVKIGMMVPYSLVLAEKTKHKGVTLDKHIRYCYLIHYTIYNGVGTTNVYGPFTEVYYEGNNPLGFPSITFSDRLRKRFHCAYLRYVLDKKFNNANCVVQCVGKLVICDEASRADGFRFDF